MKRLILLTAAALLLPGAAAAQTWMFSADVPSNPDRQFSSTHGLATDDADRVWVMPFSSAVDSLNVGGTFQPSGTVMVFDADGNEAGCSPIRFLANSGGTVTDSLGGFTNSGGAYEGRTGRGMTADFDNNVLISMFDTVFKVDAASCGTMGANTVMMEAKATPFGPGGTLTAAGVDSDNNVYLTKVVPPAPIVQLSPTLANLGNATTPTIGFNRSVYAASEPGNPGAVNVFRLDYTTGPYVEVWRRADEFSSFDSLGVTLRGFKAESSTYQPTNDGLMHWFSAGSDNDIPENGFEPETWYGFMLSDLIDFNATPVATIENPTARESIAWNNPIGGRPRAIAFDSDGDVAYIGEFSQAAPATQKFGRTSNPATEAGAIPGVAWLEQNAPNPASASTEIRFTLDRTVEAHVRLYDIGGRELLTVLNETLPAGDYARTVTVSDLPAGTYLYTLEVEGQVTSRSMLVVR